MEIDSLSGYDYLYRALYHETHGELKRFVSSRLKTTQVLNFLLHGTPPAGDLMLPIMG